MGDVNLNKFEQFSHLIFFKIKRMRILNRLKKSTKIKTFRYEFVFEFLILTFYNRLV